ncbi:MAG: hypothetical protein ABID54_07350 [Pseudomonadota bacterium]
MVVRIQAKNLEEGINKLGDMIMVRIASNAKRNINEVEMPWGDSQFEDSKGRGKKRLPRKDSLISYSGDLAGSVHVSGHEIRVSMPYAEEIEYGSPPKDVEFDKIYTWVGRKLGIKDKVKTKPQTRFATNIVNAIAREGIPAHPYLRPAIASVLNNLESELKRGEKL